MLVITRRAGERVYIGPSVTATVVASGGGLATLEIVTPLSMLLLPEETWVHQPPVSPGFERPPVTVSRRVDESIIIGAEIEVKIVAAKNDVAKLGIKAPAHVQIFREEIYERIVLETREAAKPTPTPIIPDEIKKRFKPPKDGNGSNENESGDPNDG
jgi:carbon storage regulator